MTIVNVATLHLRCHTVAGYNCRSSPSSNMNHCHNMYELSAKSLGYTNIDIEWTLKLNMVRRHLMAIHLKTSSHLPQSTDRKE